jgi:4-diphosphocytidyl-2-C-methyl-D-erythritol kinase
MEQNEGAPHFEFCTLNFSFFIFMPSLSCPAKINLFLEVRGRRADGFHELGTLFQAVETGDTLRAEPWDSLMLEGAGGVTENPDDNLVLKAARLLRERYSNRVPAGEGIRFALEKRLPSGAGLGGGSSDAAAALRLANAIWKLDLTGAELRALGTELGSDVPFFLSTPTAYGESRGEDLTLAPTPFPFHVVIATPHRHVETVWAYRELARELARVSNGVFGNRWPTFRARYAESHDDPAMYAELHNDFEEPVMAYFAEIRGIREILTAHSPVKAMLSGSGASVFALFPEPVEAEAARAEAAPKCRFTAVTRFLTEFPEVLSEGA